MDRIGRYKIVRELGRGAMGVVYHAIDPNIGRPVAIKTIQFASNRKPEELDRMRERLFREARSAGILSHPGIVTIYDVDQQDGLAYIAMEFVDGPTLEQLLSGSAALPPDRMFSILGQTAVALDYAHSKGIVHRDIKPANIMVTADGTAKITDFGIAKITASEQFTMTGSIVGTPHYMSPEQVQGHAVDGRSDQFSLGVIAYEMLTGEKPYTGEHLTTVVYKIVAEEPAAPRRLNPTLTPAIEGVVRKGLAKRPDGRYRSCQEFAGALEEACSASKGWRLMPRAGLLNEPTMADAQPAARSRDQAAAPGSRTLPPPRRPRRNEANSTSSTTARRNGGFIPFLIGMLVVACALTVIGWQAAPWLLPPRARPPASQPVIEPPPSASESSAPQSAPQTSSSLPPASSVPASPAEAKPSALGPPPPQPAREEPAVRRAGSSTAGPRDVVVVSYPSGATARLDGDPAASCTTPCTLQATGGRHRVTISAPSYQIEIREIVVGEGTLEMTPVTLRAATGTLMLTSEPSGAVVSVNGHRINQVTPANLTLGPGTYTVTIEKNGQQSTDTIEIKDGVTTYRKVFLSQ